MRRRWRADKLSSGRTLRFRFFMSMSMGVWNPPSSLRVPIPSGTSLYNHFLLYGWAQPTVWCFLNTLWVNMRAEAGWMPPTWDARLMSSTGARNDSMQESCSLKLLQVGLIFNYSWTQSGDNCPSKSWVPWWKGSWKCENLANGSSSLGNIYGH